MVVTLSHAHITSLVVFCNCVTSTRKLSLGKLFVNLSQVVKRTTTTCNTPLLDSYLSNIMKIKMHSSSCEIEDFVETHLCKLCVILRSRVLLCVSSLRIVVVVVVLTLTRKTQGRDHAKKLPLAIGMAGGWRRKRQIPGMKGGNTFSPARGGGV